MKLTEKVLNIMNILSGNGFEAFAVGGCVRDMIMGKTPYDYDITTNALPDQICECFKDFKVIKTGIKHGTVTVVTQGENIEITTYRTDGNYIDNRHPEEVNFTSLLKDDLARRDFTMNAIAFNPEIGIQDPFCGENDIKNKIIKCVGNPDKRFNEDGLRILRAIRFAAQTGFEIESETSQSIFTNKDLIKNLSAERIFTEFKKLLCGEFASEVLDKYAEVIGVFIPEVLPMVGFKQNTKYHNLDVYSHTLKALNDIESTALLRFAMFFHDIGKPKAFYEDKNGTAHFRGHAKIGEEITGAIFDRLKSDNITKEKVCALVEAHTDDISSNKTFLKLLISEKGFDFVEMLLKVKMADGFAKAEGYSNKEEIMAAQEMVAKIRKSGEPLFLSDLKIKGDHILNMGISGEKIGETLRFLLHSVIIGETKNDLKLLTKKVEEINEIQR